MTQETYAKYFQAYPTEKRSAAQLTSSNSLVGASFSLKPNSKKTEISIINKFGYKTASLNAEDSKQVQLWLNKGLKVEALLSYVAYNEPKSQHFAEFLIIAYPDKDKKAYERFIENISDKLQNAARPDIKLDKFEQNEIVKNKGDVKLKKMLGKPKLEKGCALLKNKIGLMDRIIEAGRQKKIGCYFASILFLLIIIGLLVLLFSQIIS